MPVEMEMEIDERGEGGGGGGNLCVDRSGVRVRVSSTHDVFSTNIPRWHVRSDPWGLIHCTNRRETCVMMCQGVF